MSKKNGVKRYLYVVITHNINEEPCTDAFILRSDHDPMPTEAAAALEIDEWQDIQEIIRLDENEIRDLPPLPPKQ